jgi:predicted NUDIX family NTP pyrophosphohydrolase
MAGRVGNMAKHSSGILMFRRKNGLEVLLGHPGGPFWAGKDKGAWSIPKGEHLQGEDALSAACREFREETGFSAEGEFLELGEVKQKSGKIVSIWAVEADCDPEKMVSNTFEMEWPPRTGKMQQFPEIDRVAWFSIEAAGEKVFEAQQVFLQRLQRAVSDKL